MSEYQNLDLLKFALKRTLLRLEVELVRIKSDESGKDYRISKMIKEVRLAINTLNKYIVNGYSDNPLVQSINDALHSTKFYLEQGNLTDIEKEIKELKALYELIPEPTQA